MYASALEFRDVQFRDVPTTRANNSCQQVFCAFRRNDPFFHVQISLQSKLQNHHAS